MVTRSTKKKDSTTKAKTRTPSSTKRTKSPQKRSVTKSLAKRSSTKARTGTTRRIRDIALMSFPELKRRRSQPPTPPVLDLAGSPAQRVRVDPRQSPFKKICDLRIIANDGTPHSGTAWFIAPRMLITAGHCVSVFRRNTSIHGLVRSIRVMPARNGETDPSGSPFGWVEVDRENLRVHERWRDDGDVEFDYGAIILPPDQPLGATIGVFNTRPFTDAELQNATATLSGYPDDVPEGTQWRETNPIRRVGARQVQYDIFTVRGQSGSPLFFGNPSVQEVCAIHNLGGAPFNIGVRITQDVINQLRSWNP